ncbi:MAG: CvpA family protein [Pseudomonadota bacterium]
MNWVDVTILGVVAFSAVISVLRGFVREAVSLAVWIGAFWLSLRYSATVADVLRGIIDSPAVRIAAAFVMLFLAVLVVGSLINYFLAKLVKGAGLSISDRILGVIFGVLRGGLVVALVLIVVGLTPLVETQAWRGSAIIDYTAPWLAKWQHWLPGSSIRQSA